MVKMGGWKSRIMWRERRGVGGREEEKRRVGR